MTIGLNVVHKHFGKIGKFLIHRLPYFNASYFVQTPWLIPLMEKFWQILMNSSPNII